MLVLNDISASKWVFYPVILLYKLKQHHWSTADSTSSDSFDGDIREDSDNGIRHSTNSEHSPEASTSTFANSINPTSDNNTSANANEEENDDDDDDDR